MRSGGLSGAHLNPGRDRRPGRHRQLPLGRSAGLHRGADDRRVRSAPSSSGSRICRIGAATQDPGAKLAVFATGPGDPATPSPNLITEIDRHGGAALRHPRHRRQRADAVEGRATSISPSSSAAACSRCSSACSCSASALSLGGPTGYAINPARDLGPRLAHAVLPIPGKGSSDWEYAWIPDRRAADRRRRRRGPVFSDRFLTLQASASDCRGTGTRGSWQLRQRWQLTSWQLEAA